MNAVIYARYSSDNQREESIEGQLRDCREYAEQNKLAIVGNYIDRALSARTADRPDFQRMIHDSEKRLFDVVLVWKLDRFSRDRYDSAHYKHILKKNGVRVISAKEAIADGPEGIILESMLEGMAEYYSAELAVKVRRGQRENAMKCRNNGGTLAYGYSVNKETGALVVNPKTAPIVREIFSRYDKGELIKSIIKDLNARGLRNNFNRPFQASAMTLLLKNRKYIGDYCYGDTIIPGGVPALVEKDVFERVQRRMEANKKSPGRAKAKEEYLLSGKVFCGTCGGHMVGECGKSRNGTFYYYYKCINAKHGHTCKRKALKRDWLERAVVVETVTKVLTDEVIDRVADAIIVIQGQENPMIPSIKEQLRACDKGLKNLLKAIEAGIFTPTTKERMEELEHQKEELNISLIRAQMAQPVFTKEEIVKWISRFKYGNINDKAYQREMIDTFLNSVYVYDDKIVFTYNFRDHAETVTLDEIEYVFCSDVNDCPPPNENSIQTGMLFFCSEILFRSDKLVYRLSAFIGCTTNWCLQVCFGSAQKTVGEAFMPPGGKTSRLFAPSGENAACTRPAEYLPYSKNVACSEIYKHQFIRLTKTDSLNWCLLGSFKHFKKAVTEERSGAELKDLRTKLTKKRNEMRRSLGSALT